MSLFHRHVSDSHSRASSVTSARLFTDNRLPTELLTEIIVETFFASLESLGREAMAGCIRGYSLPHTDKSLESGNSQKKDKWEGNVIRTVASVSFCFREIVSGIAVKTFGEQTIYSGEDPVLKQSEQILHAHKCYRRLTRHIVHTCQGSFHNIGISQECIKGGFADVYKLYWTSSWMHASSLAVPSEEDDDNERLDTETKSSIYRTSRTEAGKWAGQQLDKAIKMAKSGKMHPGFAARLLDTLELERQRIRLFESAGRARREVEEALRRSSEQEASVGDNLRESGTDLDPLKESIGELEKSLQVCKPWLGTLFEKEKEIMNLNIQNIRDGMITLRKSRGTSCVPLVDFGQL